MRGPDYTRGRVKLTAGGWYVDGEPVTEQKAAETLDYLQEVIRDQSN